MFIFDASEPSFRPFVASVAALACLLCLSGSGRLSMYCEPQCDERQSKQAAASERKIGRAQRTMVWRGRSAGARTHAHCALLLQSTKPERVVKFDLKCERDRIEYGMISQMTVRRLITLVLVVECWQ